MGRIILVLAFGFFMASGVWAQEQGEGVQKSEEFKEKHAGATGDGMIEKYDEYYDKDKFNSLAGQDGLLTEEDWVNNRTQREAQAFGDERWDRAVKFDVDGDGALDLDEAKAYKQAEKQKLIKHKDELPNLYQNRQLIKEHPEAAKQLYEDAKEHPEVAKKVYKEMEEHPKWTEKTYHAADEHPEASKHLYQDAKDHPEAAKKVYRAAEEHPVATKQLYKDADRHPEAAKKIHQAAENHPQATKKVYRAVDNHPVAAKKAYSAGKQHPGAARVMGNHPGKAKDVMQRRRR